MKTKDIRNADELRQYIEGVVNDFELGVSNNEETCALIADLVNKACLSIKHGIHIANVTGEFEKEKKVG
ncbi:MAG: hypothetical protein HEP71_34165 [Roseivirga sp.]|nr:hypothetical protein [Roseivirga sp.]